ncbi:MAG: peptide chain release factor N(5)-glutamine methyltransferase [Bacteroidota bacterium]
MEIHTAKLGELQALMKKELQGVYPSPELEAIIRGLFSHITGLNASMMVIEKEKELSESDIYFLQRAARRLKKYEPLQYITGTAYFRGIEFKVDPAVLIPRPETEELPEWMLEGLDRSSQLKILDIGTGSGCIAISLKKELPASMIYAVDISEEALQLAQQNASDLDAEIFFMQIDILDRDSRSVLPEFDAIISNPPYVTPADRLKMQRNVTDYEPGLALFVEEDDPLLFYREIIAFSKTHLADGGQLFLECNESYATEVKALLLKSSFRHAEVRKDMQGRERMVMGERMKNM